MRRPRPRPAPKPIEVDFGVLLRLCGKPSGTPAEAEPVKPAAGFTVGDRVRYRGYLATVIEVKPGCWVGIKLDDGGVALADPKVLEVIEVRS